MRVRRMQRWLALAAVFAAAAVLVALYLGPSGFAPMVRIAANTLRSEDVKAVRILLRSYGPFAPAGVVALMVFQALAVPLASSPVVRAAAGVFGASGGFALAYAGLVLGACAVWAVARALARPLLDAPLRGFPALTAWLERHAFAAVLVARLLPLPADVVSLACGALPLPFRRYLAATAIGLLPSTALLAALPEGTVPYFALLALQAGSLVAALAVVAATVLVSRRVRPIAVRR